MGSEATRETSSSPSVIFPANLQFIEGRRLPVAAALTSHPRRDMGEAAIEIGPATVTASPALTFRVESLFGGSRCVS